MNMGDKQLVRLSKWIALRLRHDPAGIGLAVDPSGWAVVDDLIAASARHGMRFDRAATRFLPLIWREGLRPMSRHDVHLSPDIETAQAVGARHGKPVVLTVGAAAMAAHGHTFRVTGNGVWLTAQVPPQYLSGLASG